MPKMPAKSGSFFVQIIVNDIIVNDTLFVRFQPLRENESQSGLQAAIRPNFFHLIREVMIFYNVSIIEMEGCYVFI